MDLISSYHISLLPFASLIFFPFCNSFPFAAGFFLSLSLLDLTPWSCSPSSIIGSDFLESSEGGVLLDSAPTPFFSPLIQWAILGKVRYINSKHFFVPQGNAAVELVSGVSSGVQAAPKLQAGSSYTLNFTLGDANDSCKATFLVGVQAGSTSRNFTLESNGTGSAVKFSMTFNAAAPDVNTITFLSYTTSQTKDGDLCGPVIDDVILSVSHGLRISVPWKSVILLCLIIIICFL